MSSRIGARPLNSTQAFSIIRIECGRKLKTIGAVGQRECGVEYLFHHNTLILPPFISKLADRFLVVVSILYVDSTVLASLS
ncbi:hypothetical protein BCR33DRAFT_715479, partial [Rhizoclosmatium globosum]